MTRRPRRPSPALLLGVVAVGLALCGLVVLALVRRAVGTEGIVAGLVLSVLPVPLMVAAFRWLDLVRPTPRRRLLFAFGWGACAATLIAVFANEWVADWLTTVVPGDTERLGLTVVAPVVEESTKGLVFVLLLGYYRAEARGVVDGVVIAGLTATGFAFTENVLYFGEAFGDDQVDGGSHPVGDTVAGTFVMRAVVSPFAHPLFTAMTGLGFALAATARTRTARWTSPVGGLLAAMALHGVWNGASMLSPVGFGLVYGMFMVPVLGLVVWLTMWSRNEQLRVVDQQLTAYAAAGWIPALAPRALSSMRSRRLAYTRARASGGQEGRTMREYQALATTLAVLRATAERRGAPADFAARERRLLDELWGRRTSVQPGLAEAALIANRPARTPPGWAEGDTGTCR